MTQHFEDILDDCISRIVLHGEPVEECLRRYPEMAPDLEPELRLAALAQRAYAPRLEAKQRARRALFAVMADQDAHVPVPPGAQVTAPLINGNARAASPWPAWGGGRETRRRLSEALDRCVDRIVLQGQSVQTCLEAYPDLAAELAPHLTVVARMGHAYAFTPRLDAKHRARAALHHTLQEEASREQVAQGRRLASWFPPAATRWGVSLAAILTAVLLGGGTVAASSDALPGDTLYPVKTALEQVTLAVQPSAEARAQLHLLYAERRAAEIGELLPRGDAGAVVPVIENLNEHIDRAGRLGAGLDDPLGQAEIKAAAAVAAARALAQLQVALERSGAAGREIAETALATSAEAFSAAIEHLSQQPPGPLPTARGTVVLRLANPLPSSFDRLLLQVRAVEAHHASGSWLTLSQEPLTLDVRRTQDAQWLVGEFHVQTGLYTQVRLIVDDVRGWSGDDERSAPLLSDVIRVMRPFTIVEGETTTVQLTLSGPRRSGEGGRQEERPAVQVLVEEPPQEQPDGRRGRPTPTPLAVSLPVPDTVRTAIEGLLDTVTREFVIIRGRTVALVASTRIQGTLREGQEARVVAEVLPNGALQATSIEVRESEERGRGPGPGNQRSDGGNGPGGDGDDRSGRGEGPGGGAQGPSASDTRGRPQGGPDRAGSAPEDEAPAPASGETPRNEARGHQEDTDARPADGGPTGSQERETRREEDEVRVRGAIAELDDTRWLVAGEVVRIGRETRIAGRPAVGAIIEVRGIRQPDGSVLAREIQVSIPAPRDEDRRDNDRQEQRREPEAIEPTATPTSLRSVQVEGAIEQMSPTHWVVAGRVVHVQSATRIEGDAVIGGIARVNGTLQPDGAILASTIRVQTRRTREEDEEERNRQGDRGRQAVPRPTSTAQPDPDEERQGRQNTPRATRTPEPEAGEGPGRSPGNSGQNPGRGRS